MLSFSHSKLFYRLSYIGFDSGQWVGCFIGLEALASHCLKEFDIALRDLTYPFIGHRRNGLPSFTLKTV